MNTVRELSEVRKGWAKPIQQMIKSRDFNPTFIRLGQSLVTEPLFSLRQLLALSPTNTTFITDGTGLETVPIAKIRKLSTALDMKTIFDSKPDTELIIFGEDHLRSKNAHRLIQCSLDALRNRHFTYYGVEHLSVEDIPTIEAFNLGQDKADDQLSSLASSENKGFWSFAADTQTALYRMARESRMTIAPLTHPKSWERIALSVSMPFFFESTLGEEPHARDCFAALMANAYLSEGGKMAVLMGRGHIDTQNGFPFVIGNFFGYKTLTIALVEREDVKKPFMVEYTPQAWNLVPHFRTMNYSASDRPPREADWLVFLPHDPRANSPL